MSKHKDVKDNRRTTGAARSKFDYEEEMINAVGDRDDVDPPLLVASTAKGVIYKRAVDDESSSSNAPKARKKLSMRNDDDPPRPKKKPSASVASPKYGLLEKMANCAVDLIDHSKAMDKERIAMEKKRMALLEKAFGGKNPQLDDNLFDDDDSD